MPKTKTKVAHIEHDEQSSAVALMFGESAGRLYSFAPFSRDYIATALLSAACAILRSKYKTSQAIAPIYYEFGDHLSTCDGNGNWEPKVPDDEPSNPLES